MPYARPKSRRPAKRRPFRKPKAARSRRPRAAGQLVMRSARPTIQRGYHPFGLTFLGKLTYNETISFTTGVLSTSSVNTFRLNSLFDPNQTGAGHQPMQYDQVSALYSNYFVYGAAFEVTFNDPTADGSWVGVRVRHAANPQNSSGKTLDQLREWRDCYSKPIQNSGRQKQVFKMYVPMNIPFGISKATLWAELETYGALVSTNPTGQCFLDTWVVHPASTDVVIHCTVKIRYYAKFFNPISVVSS